MKLHLKSLFLLTLAVGSVRAAEVTWGDTDSFGLGTSTGVPMAAGDLLRIGTFDINNGAIQANSSNFSFLNANFIQFDSTTVGTGVSGASAYWTQDSTFSTNGLGINGSQIYIWAFNAVTGASATEQGIYTSTAANWFFPADSAIPNTTAVDLDQVNVIVLGGFGVGTSSASGSSQPLFNTAVIGGAGGSIPEPSTYALLGGLAALGLVAGRRRFQARA